MIVNTAASQAGSASFEVTPVDESSAATYQIYTSIIDPNDNAQLYTEDEIGGNNTSAATTNDILSNQLVSATLSDSNDVDFFRLANLAVGSRIVVIMDDDPDGDGQLTDTDLFISDGVTALAFGENFSGNPVNAAGAHLVTVAGDYFIRVADGAFGTDNDYQFVVQVIGPDLDNRIIDGQGDNQLSNDTFGEGTFSGDEANHAMRGGGIFNQGQLSLVRSSIRNNEATGAGASSNGGGIYSTGGGSLVDLQSSTVEANRAGQNGGGIYNTGGVIQSQFSTIQNNSAQHGGGIFNTGGQFNAQSTSVQDNQASGDGGGIYNEGGVVTFGVRSSSETGSIQGNTADDGAGIYNDALSTLTLNSVGVGENVARGDGGGLANFGTATLNDADIGGERIVNDQNDFWEIRDANVGDLIFAYVDTQNSTANRDSTLSVLSQDLRLIQFDDDDGPGLSSVVAGRPVTQAGSVFFEVRIFGNPDDNPIDSYQLYSAVVNPNDAIDEVEGNDVANPTVQDITPGASGSLVTGSAAGSDLDHFRLANVAVGSRIVVIMDDDPDNDGLLTDTELNILDSNGVVVATADDLSFNNGNASGAFQVLTAGDYYVQVGNGRIGTESNYRFVVQVLSGNATDVVAEVESNNTRDTAQDLEGAGFSLSANSDINDLAGQDISTTIPHVTIQGTGDGTFDYYSFSAASGQRGIFDIDGASFDTELFLFDSNGNILAQNDDNGSDQGSNSFFNSFIEHDFTSSGTFVLGVGRFNSFVSTPPANPQQPIEGSPPPAGGTYTLHVSIGGHDINSGGQVNEDEPNGLASSASELLAGRFGQGSLGSQLREIVISNTAERGGGIFNQSTLTVDGGQVQNNTATGGSGGGIFTNGTALIRNSVSITENSASGDGGGIYLEAGSVDLTNESQVDNNTAQNGGGIYITSQGDVTLTDASLSGNLATGDGGGIANFGTLTASSSVLGVRGVTIPSTDENDYWSRTANTGDLAFAFVDGRNSMSSQDATLRILADDQQVEIESDDDDGPGSSPVVAGAAVPQNGSVFFEVSGFSQGHVDAYQLYTAIVDSAPDTIDGGFNETRAMAQDLAVSSNSEGVLVQGTLDSSTDLDFFSLGNVPANSVVVVMMDDDPERDGLLTDTDLFLVDGNGSTLAFGDNFSGAGGNAVVFEVGSLPQNVFVRIGDGTFGSDVSYQFVVQIHDNSNRTLETETNDEPDIADPLTAGDVGQGDVGGLFIRGANQAGRGGGIYSASTAILDNVFVENNLSTGDGGGIFSDGGANLTLTTSSVADNSADGFGGGLFNAFGATLDLVATGISRNMAGADGGGVFNAGELDITDFDLMDNDASSIDNNAAASGGGIYNSSSSLTVDSTVISGNLATSFHGGGIYNAGTASIGNDTQFNDNEAALGDGGAIYNHFAATLTVDPGNANVPNISFAANQANTGDGGAIANRGTADIQGVTIGDESTRLSPLMNLNPFGFGGPRAESNDLWEIQGGNVNDLVFAYVDTQNAVADRDSTLTVLGNNGLNQLEFDDDDGPGLSSVVAGAALAQPGSVFFDIRNFGSPDPISDYQLYATRVSPIPGHTESAGSNDTTGTAEDIDFEVTNNQLVAGSLSSASDVDVFSFQAQVGDRIVVMLDGDPADSGSSTRTRLEIRDVSNAILASHSGFGSANALGAVIANTAGTYFVRISDNGSTVPGNYRFVAQVLSSDDRVDEVEPNNVVNTANELLIGEFSDGELTSLASTGNTVETDDYWRVTGANSTDAIFAYVDTRNSNQNQDSTLTVFGNQQNQIAFNDDGGPGLSSVVAGLTGQTGTVSLDVRNFGFPDAMGYELYVAVVDGQNPTAEVEGNDTQAAATPINADTLVTGDLGDGTDDFFSFNASAGDRIVVMMDNDPEDDFSSTGTTLQLLDSSGGVLDTNTSFSGSSNAIGAMTVATGGTFFVRVAESGFGGLATSYNFVVRVESSTPFPEQEPNDEISLATELARDRFGQGQLELGGESRQASNRANRGGGIYNAAGAALDLNDVTIQFNQALGTMGGGGIFNEGSLRIGNEAEPSFSFINDNFTGTSGSGAGIFNSPTGDLDVFDSFVFGNSAQVNGGGLANQGRAELVRTTVGDVADANDFFLLPDAEAGQQIFAYVDTQRNAENSDSLLEIFIDENGNKMVQRVVDDDDSGPGLSSLVAGETLAVGGDLFFNVQSADPSAPLTYEFFTAVVSLDDRVLENPVNGITNLAIDDETRSVFVEGNLDLIAGTDDLFRITANEGDRVVVMLDGDPDGNGQGTFTELALLTANQSRILPLSDTIPDPANSVVNDITSNALGTVTIAADGTYILRVRGARNPGQGNYRFVVLVLPGTLAINEDLQEFNNTPKAAVPLAEGQFGEGAIRVLASNEAAMGGGISNETVPSSGLTARLTVRESNIARNTATRSGGGLFNSADSVVNVVQSTFEFNVADDGTSTGRGGGIFSEGTLNLTNVTISGNQSREQGGGVFLESDSTSDFGHTTIALNGVVDLSQPGVGGGIFSASSASLTLFSTLVAQNQSGVTLGMPNSGVPDDVFGQVATNSQFNLIEFVRSSIGLTHDVNNNQVGGSGQSVQARLEPLSSNGGPTRTHAISRFSDAFDAGPNTLNPFGPVFDQRGTDPAENRFLRLVGAAIDIGAFELQAIDGTSDDLVVTSNATGQNEILIFSAFNSVVPNDVVPPGLSPISDAGVPSAADLTLNDPLGQQLRPYALFEGEVRTAVGDVNGDGFDDVIAVPGAGGGPHVRVFLRNPQNGAVPFSLANVIDFFPYDFGFIGGIFVAVADFNQDGFSDIVVGADAGGGPNVIGINGREIVKRQGQVITNAQQLRLTPNEVLFDFFPYNIGFTGGVRVAAADVNGDGTPDLITAPGAGGGPHVRVFDGRRLPSDRRALTPLPGREDGFFAYNSLFAGGVFIAAADIDGDGRADIITGPGAGGGPHIRVFSGLDGSDLIPDGFFAYSPFFTGGVRVSSGDYTGDGLGDIITAAGPGGGFHVRYFDISDPEAFQQQVADAQFDLHQNQQRVAAANTKALRYVAASAAGKASSNKKFKRSRAGGAPFNLTGLVFQQDVSAADQKDDGLDEATSESTTALAVETESDESVIQDLVFIPAGITNLLDRSQPIHGADENDDATANLGNRSDDVGPQTPTPNSGSTNLDPDAGLIKDRMPSLVERNSLLDPELLDAIFVDDDFAGDLLESSMSEERNSGPFVAGRMS